MSTDKKNRSQPGGATNKAAGHDVATDEGKLRGTTSGSENYGSTEEQGKDKGQRSPTGPQSR